MTDEAVISEQTDEELDEEYEDDEIVLEEWTFEDLLHKRTKSFQCLAQIEISRSSLLRDPLYYFPEIEDPNLEEALWGTEPPPEYDDIGVQRYKDLCKKEGIIPFRRVIQSLETETLDLKVTKQKLTTYQQYYALNEKAMHTICETLQYNHYIQNLILQENWLKPESVAHLANLIQYNKIIHFIDLNQCQIGNFGAEQLGYSTALSKSLVVLDLSHNNLGDEGIEYLAAGFRDNASIKVLNLSHNGLGDRALVALRPVLEDNYMLKELDLSWNYLYSPIGIKELMEGLAENIALCSLNLSWNGIGDVETFKYILMYLKNDNSKIQDLNLSNNRITGQTARMLRNGLKVNESIVSLNVGFNPLTPEEVEMLCQAFFDVKENVSPLNFMDFGNTWVNKSFIRLRNRIVKKGCKVNVGGIYSNYKIIGPNVKEVLLNRAKVVAMKPKKKKQRKDIGQFIIQFKEDEIMKKEDFLNLIKKNKIKLDAPLVEMIAKTFNEGKQVNLQDIKNNYLRLYPDTVPPPPKKKGGKGKKGKKKKK